MAALHALARERVLPGFPPALLACNGRVAVGVDVVDLTHKVDEIRSEVKVSVRPVDQGLQETKPLCKVVEALNLSSCLLQTLRKEADKVSIRTENDLAEAEPDPGQDPQSSGCSEVLRRSNARFFGSESELDSDPDQLRSRSRSPSRCIGRVGVGVDVLALSRQVDAVREEVKASVRLVGQHLRHTMPLFQVQDTLKQCSQMLKTVRREAAKLSTSTQGDLPQPHPEPEPHQVIVALEPQTSPASACPNNVKVVSEDSGEELQEDTLRDAQGNFHEAQPRLFTW